MEEKILLKKDYTNKYLQELFEEYLLELGYREFSDSGNRSTVHDYCQRVKRVCDREGISWQTLANNIHYYIFKYDVG